jgi:hypothetical protein
MRLTGADHCHPIFKALLCCGLSGYALVPFAAAPSRYVDRPCSFCLDALLFAGWDNGLLNMCIGEKRKLVIPSGLGYGDHGSPPKIPGGATLVFEVELLEIK